MPPTTTRIRKLISQRNNEIMLHAVIELALGVLFCVLVYGFVFVWMWGLGGFFATQLSLTRTQFALSVVGLFMAVCFFSAWRRVDPLQSVAPMTDTQLMLTYISLASPNLLYFSPRHASAGVAAILIGGPKNILSAIGNWRHRLPGSSSLVAEAADLLILAQHGVAINMIPSPRAAVLLRRLALIKPVDHGHDIEMVLTENGRETLAIS